MDKIKCYECKCGEDFYEDDTECCNCGAPVDQSKFKDEPLMKVISQGEITEVKLPFLKENKADGQMVSDNS